MSEPKSPNELSLGVCRDMLRVIQEILWLDETTGWTPRESWRVCAENIDRLAAIADVLCDYELHPIEQKAKEDDE